MIITVKGPLQKNRLGRTLPHEHVIETAPGFENLFPEINHRDTVLQKAKKEFRELYDLGIRSVIDTTTYDIGRDPEFLLALSEASDINIICSTGCYFQITPAFSNQSEIEITKLFIREIEQGIGTSGIKPGVIKVATGSEGFTDITHKMFRAASKAHLETGTPITTHTWAQGETGLGQLEIFDGFGIDLSNVCIGHSDDSKDIKYLKKLCDSGAFVAFDKLYPVDRHGESPNIEARVENLAILIESGYSHCLFMSHDWSIYAPAFWPELEEADRKKQNPYGYKFISIKVVPDLLDRSVEQQTIDQIMINNPAEVLNISK